MKGINIHILNLYPHEKKEEKNGILQNPNVLVYIYTLYMWWCDLLNFH